MSDIHPNGIEGEPVDFRGRPIPAADDGTIARKDVEELGLTAEDLERLGLTVRG